MNKFTLSLICILLFAGSLSAQSYGHYKKAKKAFEKYQQSSETPQLYEAYELIQKSVEGVGEEDAKKATKIWMKAGEIYNEIALEDYKIFLVNNNHQPAYPEIAAKAYHAYQKAVDIADKKWDKNAALDELLKTATFISNEGIIAYNIEKYEEAYASFQMIMDIKQFLHSKEHVSILNGKEEYRQHIYKTALAAHRANLPNTAIDYFQQLVEVRYNKPVVYTALSDIYIKKGASDKSLESIQLGREMFPKNENLMIAEINHYLAIGQVDQLTDKLEAAIKNQPRNVSLYATLGHVYNELQKKEVEKGNFTLAKNYFGQSLRYFTQALEIEDTYAPALYNLGALYYNNAAVITKEIKAIEGDKSAKGIRQVSAKHSEMMRSLDQALPFFKRAESVNPSDTATLQALKEIFDRKNDKSLVDEFSNRLAKLAEGQAIEKAYFGG